SGVRAQLALAADGAGAGQHGDAGLGHRGARADLVAHEAHGVGRRADPGQLALGTDLRELGVLGQEAVAGVDRVGAGDLGGADDRWDVEVALARRRRADAHRLIGELDVERARVGGRVDRDRLEPHLAQRADHAECDLAAVGYQDLLEHRRLASSPRRSRARYAGAILNSACPYSTGAPSSARIPITVPAMSASISFMSFIASTMQSTWPLSTRSFSSM